MGDIDEIVANGERQGRPKYSANFGYFEDGKENAENVERLFRTGDDKDVKNLEKTYKENRKCNFRSLLSPRKEDLLHLLSDREKFLRFFASTDAPSVFVLYILSYGAKDGVIYTDHKQREETDEFASFTTRQIIESLKMLSGFEDCLKIVNFGPCRGEIDDALYCDSQLNDESIMGNKNSCRITYSPGMQNLVIFYSTVETTRAKRNLFGSTFAHESCKVLDLMENDEPLIDVLTTIQLKVHNDRMTTISQTPELKYFTQSRRFHLFKYLNTSNGDSSDGIGKIVREPKNPRVDFYSWVSDNDEKIRRRHAFLLYTCLDETVANMKESLSLNLDFVVSDRKLNAQTLELATNEASNLEPLDVGCILTCIFAPVKQNTDDVCVLIGKSEIKIADILHKLVGPRNEKWIGKPKIILVLDQKTDGADDIQILDFKISATNHSGWLVLVLHDQGKILELIDIFKGQELKRGRSLQDLLTTLLISKSKENKDFLNATLQYKLDFPDLPQSFVQLDFSWAENGELNKHRVSFDALTNVVGSSKENRIWVLSALAGAGKSTLFKEMAFQLGKLRIGLKALLVDLQKIPFDDRIDGLPEFEFLAEATYHLTEKVTEWIEQKKCVVMLDGFDGISLPFRGKVLKIVEFLKNRKIQVWIGTRPHDKDALLRVVPDACLVDIEPLSVIKQVTLLQQVSKRSEQECKRFVDAFPMRGMLENPMILTLFAQSKEQGNLCSMFDHVVRRQVEAYLVQREGCDKNSIKFGEKVDSEMEFLQEIASRHVRKEAIVGHDVCEEDLEKINGYGIATFINSRVEFLHEAFAEFLTAQKIVNDDTEHPFDSQTSDISPTCSLFLDAYHNCLNGDSE